MRKSKHNGHRNHDENTSETLESHGGHHHHHGRGGDFLSLLETTSLELTQTDNGNEFTIESDSLDSILSATLDDTSATDDSIIINLVEVDGEDQSITAISSLGIEDITLNVVLDESNDTDDIVNVSNLITDDTISLNIISEESIIVDTIEASNLETIDLTASTAGFDIGHTHSTNGVTYLVDTIGDGVGTLNFDIDNDGIKDTSVSTIELNNGVQDTIQFTATSLESDLLIQRAEVGTDTTADIIDLSTFGILSIDELTFTDIENSYDYDSNSSVIISSDSFDGDIILCGVLSSDIDSSNFIFAS